MKMSLETTSMHRKILWRFLTLVDSRIADIARAFFIQKTVWIIVIGVKIVHGCTRYTQHDAVAQICSSAMNHGTAIKISSIVISVCLVLIFLLAAASVTEKMQFSTNHITNMNMRCSVEKS